MAYDEILAASRVLFRPGQTVEVRALGKRGTASGYYTDFEKLARDVHTLNQSGEYAGVYITLNPVNPDLLARRANRIETRLGKTEATTADGDIIRRVWLPVDIDPVRPSGVSSSETEHAAARVKAFHIAEYLTDLGWPDPVVADSGNGAHLLYGIDLDNTEESRDLVKGVLGTLDILFSDAVCQVDTANFNAARIWKLYGTTSRKGDNTETRPHRDATLLSAPDDVWPLHDDQLSHLARMFPTEEPPKPTTKDRKLGVPIDLADWLTRNGIGYEEKPYNGGSLFVLDECPFSGDHKDGAYCIQFSNGAIFAGCHHNSCGGGSQRWPELRERYEGTIEDRLKKLKLRRGGEGASEASDRPQTVTSTPLASGPDLLLAKTEAYRVIHEGDPLRYMLDTFALDHIGDPVVAECLAMSLASRQVINAKGLHVSVTGESGKGKSHTFDTMMQQVPEEMRLEGRMSDKALFYIKMKPGTVIALDDVSLSDHMQEILKGVTTSFRKPFRYHTVNKDRGGQTLIIPERCVWWVAKVEGTGDDQVWNRMLTCWIDDSEEQDARVLAHTLHEAAAIPDSEPGIRSEVLVCQEIWRSLHPVHVVVPFAEEIRFSSSMNRRNPDMLLDLVKCHAVLMQHQRDRTESGNMICITATVEDFRKACRLYTALNGKSGGQQSKLTRKESDLLDAIRSRGQGEITITEMQHITGWSYSVINKMLHGQNAGGYHYSGLLEKCPAVSVCDRTLVTDESGTCAAHRRSKVYTWDPYVYDSWVSDGGCWLDGHGKTRKNGGDDVPPSDDVAKKIGFAKSGEELAKNLAMKPAKDCGGNEDLSNNNNNNNIIAKNPENCSVAISDPDHASDHISDSDFLARSDLTPSSGADTHPVSESEHFNNGYIFSQGLATTPDFSPEGDLLATSSQADQAAGRDLASLGPSPTPSLTVKQIRPGDYIEIDTGYGSGPCDCCGYKWVNYQERMTRERMKQPARFNRKICKKCYQIAKEAETAPVRALPGVLNTAGMVRLYKDLGRCQVCNGGKAVWTDPENHVHICESCYHNHGGNRAGVMS